MIKIRQAVIVEGKYDKIKLSSIIDAPIIQTDGFGIFRDKELQRLIRRLAQTRGILVLTDSDSAGFKIRNFIGSTVDRSQVFHAYIPDIYGKERRKTAPSKEGKLGVEGVPEAVIVQALENAGVLFQTVETPERPITKTDFYTLGLSGKKDSAAKRAALLRRFDLPGRLSANALLTVLNCISNYEDLARIVREIEEAEVNASDRTGV